MTPEERWKKIENALATAARLQAENAAMVKDLLRAQIESYRSHDRLIPATDAMAQATIRLREATITLNQTIDRVMGKLDRLIDLAEEFLRRRNRDR